MARVMFRSTIFAVSFYVMAAGLAKMFNLTLWEGLTIVLVCERVSELAVRKE